MTNKYIFKTDDEIAFYTKLQNAHVKQQHQMSEDEGIHLKDEIGKPLKIVDLGCGIGRSSVYFNKIFNLDKSKFYLCDFNKNTYRPKGEGRGPLGYHDNNKPIPFNSLDLTKRFSDLNELKNIELIDLDTDEITKLKDINLVYSFYSVGYHWSIDDAIEKYNLLGITAPDAKFIFGIRKKNWEKNTRESKFLKLNKEIEGQVLEDFGIYSKK